MKLLLECNLQQVAWKMQSMENMKYVKARNLELKPVSDLENYKRGPFKTWPKICEKKNASYSLMFYNIMLHL